MRKTTTVNVFLDELIQPDNTCQMSGNKISVRTLDLSRDFAEIAAQLNAIVIKRFGSDSINIAG